MVCFAHYSTEFEIKGTTRGTAALQSHLNDSSLIGPHIGHGKPVTHEHVG